ncbi:DUF2834 domain-containing protein [Prochlorococcus sp. MIT 1223]|uniref:DUF2834 domain-containing protein n=1 Tax=Prochlorococcus sp. MIT 1223 TaxID=3096217 RepID=UPI002A749812|nr:DUF2834 domain-containing protein [Prochlorococcus sp. MIT 1223]
MNFSSRHFLSYVYLFFAILGFILPTLANIDFVITYGAFDIVNFFSLANINPAAQSLSRDLLVGAGAVTVWIFSEAKRLSMKNLWIVIASFLIAFAFAAPLFLFLRERRLIEIEKA